MRSQLLVFGAVLAISLLALPREAASGEDVVLTVGSSRLTVADVERRLANVPAFQLSQFGSTPNEIKRNFVERVLVPELLYGDEATRRVLANKPALQTRMRELLRQALEQELRDSLAKSEPVTDADTKAYFEQQRSRFETPRRIRLWRILVADQALAKQIAQDARATDGPAKWTEAARKHSLDKATNMRSGDLGFVRPDGTTDTPRVQVDVALFAAADKLKDGEILAEPVKEGERWAAIWRRGSMPAVSRTLEQEQASIRQILQRKKLDDRRSALLDELKKKHVRDVDESLLDHVNMSAFGDVAARTSPAVVPRRPARIDPAPVPGDRGQR